MADTKISDLTGATTPLAGTEVVPVVQSSTTKNVSVANLTAGRAVAMSTLETTGNAGVGTSSPDVFGRGYGRILGISSASNSAIEINSATGNGAYIDLGVNNTRIANIYADATSISFSGIGSQSMSIGTNNAPAIVIDTSQNVFPNTDGTKTLGASGNNWGNIYTKGNLVQGTAAKGINFTANTPAAGMTSQLLNWYEEGTWTPSLTSAGGNFTTIAYGDQQGSYTRVGRQVTVRGNLFTSGAITAGSASGQVYIAGLPFTVSIITLGNIWFNPDSANYNQPTALATGVMAASTTLRLFKNGSINNPEFNVTELYTAGGPANNMYFEATYFV